MKTLQFLNRQKTCVLDRQLLRRIARELLEEMRGGADYTLAVHFVGAPEMTGINERFLGHGGSTDVITFDYIPRGKERKESMKELEIKDQRIDGELTYFWAPSLNGEIFICIDEALIQARRFRVSWQTETVRYLVHGLLHMDGCDDSKPELRREMKRRENNLLKKLSRRFELGKLGRLNKTVGAHERK